MVLYVTSDSDLPVPLPDHDVAIVIASDSDECREALRNIDRVASQLAEAAAQSAAACRAIWIATSCIICSTESKGLIFPRRSP